MNFEGELPIGFMGESTLFMLWCADGKFFFDALFPYCFAFSILSLRERFYFSFDIEFLLHILDWAYARVDLRISGWAGTFCTFTNVFSVLLDLLSSCPWVGVFLWPRVLRFCPCEFTLFERTLPALLILQSGSNTPERDYDYSRVDSWITEGMIWG